ncbi:AraC family transcriptional regulator [Echinicola strongylocentroti]|uniref:AraC family transcriptional regulator n=1 Tax=Echinicola strongylocentroti TaxID=1795355 RepID=A0A2Z4IMC3_9BACT|nr:AraC family transcriptional regulator [Echinicola strongylocentroti]AWW32045.1 AraC family transcriptional regulator [Echinicola strongylocentroti]
MKPLLFKIAKTNEEAVRILQEDYPYFYDKWHYHVETQIMVIVEGEGTYFIGDAIGHFKAGDIFILGSNLPHFFRSEQQYYQGLSTLHSKNISVLFALESMGERMLDLPEFFAVRKLLERSKRGLMLEGDMRKKMFDAAHVMAGKEGLERIIYLFDQLHSLSISNELRALSHVNFEPGPLPSDTKKINGVIRFIMENFSKEITVSDAANVANLSIQAFCRYFKLHTRKTFSQFLNEIRIGHACKLLIEDGYSKKEIAFQSGYDNISYFNRQFKQITSLTPSEYARAHRINHNQAS